MWVWPNMSNERKRTERWIWRARNSHGDFEGGFAMTKIGAWYKCHKAQR